MLELFLVTFIKKMSELSGGAFGKIVNSLVNDVIMPPIGWILSGVGMLLSRFH